MSDLISRQAALDAIDKHCDVVCQYSKKQRYVMCGACTLGGAFDVIEQLPSAQPEQKTGEWVLKTLDDGYGEFQIYECDQCGAYTAQRRNFCYNCGAKMDVEKEIDFFTQGHLHLGKAEVEE